MTPIIDREDAIQDAILYLTRLIQKYDNRQIIYGSIKKFLMHRQYFIYYHYHERMFCYNIDFDSCQYNSLERHQLTLNAKIKNVEMELILKYFDIYRESIKEVIYLRWYEHKSVKEISKELHLDAPKIQKIINISFKSLNDLVSHLASKEIDKWKEKYKKLLA